MRNQDKLPIPRLQRERRESGGRRTSRACNPCRERKTKCDGNKPICSQCRGLGVTSCFYPESLVNRLREELKSVRAENENYLNLLQDLKNESEEPIAEKISKGLKSQRPISTRQRRRPSSASSSSSLGSLEEVDTVYEDINRSELSRATGYLGKNSEVTWMQRLDLETANQAYGEDPSKMATNSDPDDKSISSLNYHLDHQRISEPDEIDIYAMPSKALADRLLHNYLQKIQISLPIIRQDLFLDQYDRFYSGRSLNPGHKWLAIFNLMMAISSAFCRLSLQDTHQVADETTFFTRAKLLNTPETIAFEHDDLQEVQVEALMAFFFLVISQVNRSWKMIGIAVRSGIALGLNLSRKNVASVASSGEARTNLWWAVVRLEHLLSVMTGRVSCLGDTSSSAPPPNPVLSYSGHLNHQPITEPHSQLEDLRWSIYLNEEQIQSQNDLLKFTTPSPSLYFFYVIDLSMITHAITNRVYATDVSRTGWGIVESRISLYSKKMDLWLKSLHPSFNFQGGEPSELLASRSSFQISLALHYYSARITLYRPCLSRPAFDKESGTRLARSRFSNVSTLACLRASLAVIMLLPDEPNLTWCYEALHWWELLHILSQATVILLLDISIGPAPSRPGEAAVRRESTEHVLNCAKKGIAWLHCLGRTSEAAQRASKFCNSCIHRIAATKHLNIDGIPSPVSSHRMFKTTPDGNKNCEAQLGSHTGYPRLANHLPSYHGEQRDGMVFQNLPEGHRPLHGLRTALAVDNSDHDMAELFSDQDNTDARIEELLLSWMAPTG
ncbi:hypothetical protein N7451_012188 [Penicillium sp. IBT 35674x]|nr:hypothetical protein N7451_012188 [Penicillium sp. IBT 35674x]